MLAYEMDDGILTMRASGVPTREDRARVFAGINADAQVPVASLFLLDVRAVTLQLESHAFAARVQGLVSGLGPKLGQVCAVVVSEDRLGSGRHFQDAGMALGLRVGLFSDEGFARSWLRAYR